MPKKKSSKKKGTKALSQLDEQSAYTNQSRAEDLDDAELESVLSRLVQKQDKINKSVKKQLNKSTYNPQKSFAEQRQEERIREASNVGPGSIDYAKPFGSEITNRMQFGGKYEFKADKNPAPGQYDPEMADKHVKPKSYEAMIKGKNDKEAFISKFKNNNQPEPGTYDGHLQPFGQQKNSMTIGGKYKWKADANPGPGQYQPDAGFGNESAVHYRNRSTVIRNPSYLYRRPKENGPAPGSYDAHLTPFGDMPFTPTMGRKYEFKVDANPGPGTYDIDRADSVIRHNSRLPVIREDSSPYRRPKEVGPSPGNYDGHLKPFGDGLQNVTMGGKTKFKPLTETAGPGAYDFADSQSAVLPRSKSAIIRMPYLSINTNPYKIGNK